MPDSFGVLRTDPERVVIRFDPSLERFLKENIWHPSQAFETDEAGNLLLTMEVGGLDEVMSWVLGFGRQAEVLSPAHLRKAVAGRYEDGLESDHGPSQTPFAKIPCQGAMRRLDSLTCHRGPAPRVSRPR